MNPNQTQTNNTDNSDNWDWLWWLLGLLIAIGLLWFFLGGSKKAANNEQAQNPDTTYNQDANGEDQMQNPDMAYPDTGDVQYDQHGLPITGPAAPISSVQVVDLQTFPAQTQLVVSGNLPNGCTYLNAPNQVREGNNFYVNLTTRTEEGNCADTQVPYERAISLDTQGLPAGTYYVNIEGQQYSFNVDQPLNQVDYNAGSDK